MMNCSTKSSPWRLSWLLLFVVVVFAGCNAVVTAFVVPAAAWAGHEFVVAVSGTGSGANLSTGNQAGCVLQVPQGFTVIARGPGIPDAPALLQLYTAEPGHYLVSQSAFVNSSAASTQFVVRAPATLGTSTFKVSLAGYGVGTSFQPVDPPGVTSFAQITAATYVRPIVVQATTADAFVLDTSALPATTSRRLVLADLDHDGNDDLIEGLGPRVWLARPGNTWLNRSPPPTGSTLEEIAVGDFDGDGHQDLVHATRTVYFGDGQGNWTLSSVQPPTNGPVVVLGSGDFNHDGRSDIVEGDANGWIRCLRSGPGRTFQSLSYGLPGAGGVPTQLQFVDADGDGSIDIVGSGSIWRGNGLGTWSVVTGLTLPWRVAVGDLFGDSRPEILVMPTGTANANIALLTHANGTTWTSSGVPFGGGSNIAYTDIRIRDLDGDGSNDVLLTATGIQAWRRSGSTFAPMAGTGLPPRLSRSTSDSQVVGAFTLGDLDGDGRPELLATSGLHGDWAPLLWRNLVTGTMRYGAGCVATGFPTPALVAIGQPQTGNAAFALGLQGGQPAGFGLLWLGLSQHLRLGQPVLPLSLAAYGAPGCTVVAEDAALHFFVLDPAGAASLPFPLPNDPSLRYLSIFGQGAALAPGANTLGLLTSNGLAIRID